MQWRCTPWILAAGILAGCADAHPTAKPSERKDAHPVFCYRTLADVDCYTEVDRGRESRLTAIYWRDGQPWWVTYEGETQGPPAAPALPLPVSP